MTSKFQNRLTGTIVLVTMGVIILPRLFDGQKKHYQDDVSAIPLMLKLGDRDASDMLFEPSKGTVEKIHTGGDVVVAVSSFNPSHLKANSASDFDPPPRQMTQLNLVEEAKQLIVEPTMQCEKASDQLAAVMDRLLAGQAQDKLAPIGKSYLVQLGALKNTYKVHEVISKLRDAGYRVYTIPSVPVQGKTTRILVGPYTSKDKLKGLLGKLNQISGLSGLLMNCSATG